jgi:hypothetical protein
MYDIKLEKTEVTNRIALIVDKFFQDNSLYQEKLDKEEVLKLLLNLFGDLSPEEIKAIDEHELTRRIRKIMTLHAVAGTLNDLTPEQIKIFDEAVEGR